MAAKKKPADKKPDPGKKPVNRTDASGYSGFGASKTKGDKEKPPYSPSVPKGTPWKKRDKSMLPNPTSPKTPAPKPAPKPESSKPKPKKSFKDK